MAPGKIGILTGGGDVPGLNAVIKSVVYGAAGQGASVTGIRRSWEGLTHVNFDDPASVDRYILPLNRDNTRSIDRSGGTMLHTSRTNPSKMKAVPGFLTGEGFAENHGRFDMSARVLKNLETLGIDCLIAIGGDDTLSFAAHLNQLGMPVIAVPKTMDNDVQHTEYCIGFSTAITRAMDAIERQRSTVGSHERIGIFRIFGRDAGYTALYTAYVSSIRCVIPEYKVNLETLIELLLEDKQHNPSRYSLVVLSEGAQWEGYQAQEYGEHDAYGHRKKASVAETLANEIAGRAKEETIVNDLTYDLRGGAPDFIDKLVASTFGTMALEAALSGQSGRMTAIQAGRYALVPIPDPQLGPRRLDVETMYDTRRYRPRYRGKVGLPVFLTEA